MGELTLEELDHWWKLSGSLSSDPVVERIVAAARAHIADRQRITELEQSVMVMAERNAALRKRIAELEAKILATREEDARIAETWPEWDDSAGHPWDTIADAIRARAK